MRSLLTSRNKLCVKYRKLQQDCKRLAQRSGCCGAIAGHAARGARAKVGYAAGRATQSIVELQSGELAGELSTTRTIRRVVAPPTAPHGTKGALTEPDRASVSPWEGRPARSSCAEPRRAVRRRLAATAGTTTRRWRPEFEARRRAGTGPSGYRLGGSPGDGVKLSPARRHHGFCRPSSAFWWSATGSGDGRARGPWLVMGWAVAAGHG